MAMKIEQVTKAQHNALCQLVVARLHEADLSRGRGVLEGNDGMDRCLWTADGHRITVSASRHGTLIVSCGSEPDPDAPAPGGHGAR